MCVFIFSNKESLPPVIPFGHSVRPLVHFRHGFAVRSLRLYGGREEFRKDRGWTVARLKALALAPAFLAGDALGRGTTIEGLFARA